MFIQWRWYCNVPSLPLWVLLLLLIVVPKHNRHRQAWLILPLPLLAAGFSLLIEWADSWGRQFRPVCHGLGSCLDECVAAGAVVASVATKCEDCSRWCAVMVAVGVVAYLGFFGAWVSSGVTLPVIGCWAVCSISLVAAAALTGLCCRGNCSSLPLVFWPMLWMPVACVLCVGVFVIGMGAVFGEGRRFVRIGGHLPL